MKRLMIKQFIILGLTLSSMSAAWAADAKKGKELFSQRCATCHGELGAGDGPAAAAFPAESKPRDLSHGQMKFAVDEAKFVELIKKGGMGVGLSPLMPPQTDLNDADISSVYAYVKSLHK